MALLANLPLSIAGLALGLLFGLVLAFAGYRLMRSFAAIVGFLVGFTVGLVASAAFTHQLLISLGIAIVVGILGAALFLFALRFVGAALLAATGVLLAQGLAAPWWGILLAGVVGGVVGFLANKLMIAVATSAIGAWLAVNSGLTLAYLLGLAQIPNESWIVLASTLLLAVLGIVVQMRDLRRHGGASSDDAAAAS